VCSVLGPGEMEKLGARSLRIRFMDECVRLSGLNEDLFIRISERYRPFILDEDGPGREIGFFRSPAPFLEESDGYLKLEESACGEDRFLLSSCFAGSWSQDGEKGRLFIDEGKGEAAALAGFENYFRWLVANLLVERGGFVFHSAGVVRDGSAYLFFGHSGAGKSTVCENSPGSGILSDDLVLVFPVAGEGYRACAAPFFGVMPQENKEPGSFHLKGCYRLRKSGEVRKRQLTKAQAFGLIVPSCPNIICGKRRNELLYPTVRKFLDSVQVYELFFKKDGTFWDAVLDDES